MEPAETTVVFVAHLKVWEADGDSFSVAGRRFFVRDHGFAVGDIVKLTIRKLPAPESNASVAANPNPVGPVDDPSATAQLEQIPVGAVAVGNT